MIYRTLGRTGLKVSALGMGTGGGLDPLGQKSGKSETEILNLLHRAFDLGINFFDTAPTYFDSELLLGRALKDIPRENLIVSTKIALARGSAGGDLPRMTASEITASLETSLRRLQMDYVDLLLLALPGHQYFDVVVNEHLPILNKLRDEGKFRFLGSSEQSSVDGSHRWLQKILPTGLLDVAMVAHNMINQSAQSFIHPLCQKHNIGVINIFTVRHVFGHTRRMEEVVANLKNRGFIEQEAVPDKNPLAWLLDDDTDSLIEAAYRYVAHADGVTTAMTSVKETAQLEMNLRSVQKGPLAAWKLKRLRDIFGQVAEPIGN